MNHVIIALALANTHWASPSRAAPDVDLQYLQHSGWIVRTPMHVLVFEYVERLPSGTTFTRQAE